MLMMEVHSFLDKKYAKLLVHIRKCCIFAIEMNDIVAPCNIIVIILK